MKRIGVILGFFLVFLNFCYGAKIGDVTTLDWREQAVRFITFKDPTLQIVLLGVIILGICCGLLGSFLIVRKKALFSDALSHAVLPGIVIGFLCHMEKNPVSLLIGAVISGLIGIWVINVLKRTTVLKEDSLLGLILTGFYAIGICLLTMLQNVPVGHQSGLDKYLFGQAAALSWGDVALMGSVTFLSIVLILCFYKELLVSSFDQEFALSTGLKKYFLDDLLLMLVTLTIVISIKAVGIVLVSAMLIIPASTAILITNRLHKVILLAIGFGLISAVVGTFLSFIMHNLPTGPFMVIVGAILFVVTFGLSLRKKRFLV
ncbi:MAG: manganese ABC transporter [Verrucomicrobia bacterium]|nr:MAG: manganese ABC transporter [Verrucomicrobiota bacterium]